MVRSLKLVLFAVIPCGYTPYFKHVVLVTPPLCEQSPKGGDHTSTL